ncbi:hypothetical protein [Jeotgalibacillus sp. R-1-5s-1]|uniref:hypothetical protein n=1 Tax=Jeotgalibacillus sp. R-1-5s-1 TaxID=2555897 RepID=UPI00106D9690|nr:hypothetical protein [Jeotgalibacillus sp. R-1-5s-1]TFE01895.1 hypothetical protein E2491_02940 [Jeotgalibacillus sp. R-1-5s-1]
MKSKGFIVGVASFAVITLLLYLAGDVFQVPLLMFHNEYMNSTNGQIVSSGSLIPVVIGLSLSVLIQRIYINRYAQNLAE